MELRESYNLAEIVGSKRKFESEQRDAQILTALQNGDPDGMSELHLVDKDIIGQAAVLAATSGSLQCLQIALEHGSPGTAQVCTRAAAGGHADCLQFALENNCDRGKDDGINITYSAIRYNRLECLRVAHEHGCKWDATASAMAASYGSSQCLQYLHENGCPWDIKTCLRAAKAQQFECLQYALSRGCPGAKLCSILAFNDHLDGLKTALECNVPWEPDTCRRAIQGGSLRCLAYALANDAPRNGDLCAQAALYGQLNCLKLCHGKSTLRSTEVCRSAARAGSLECLRFAHEHGYPWSPEVCSYAAHAGHVECLLYAARHGCPTETFSEGFLRCWEVVKEDVLDEVGL